MLEFLGDLSGLIEKVIIIVVIGGLGWIINHFRNKAKDMGKLRKKIEQLQIDSIDQDKAIMVIAKLIDVQSKKLHPKEHIELQGIAKEILTKANRNNNNK